MSSFHIKKRYKILAGIIAFIAILLFALPRVACHYVVKHSKELTGRKLDIDRIRLNYFTGTLRIYDAKLYESDDTTVFVSFKKFVVNLDYLPLFKKEIFVKSISLDDPYGEVLQNGDRFNFSDMMPSDTAKTVQDTVKSAPTKYTINNISINRGYVKYSDLKLNHTIAMNRLDLQIPGFTWNSDSTNLDVNFRFVDGGGLRSSLAINQADSTYSVNVKLDSLNLDIIEPYLKSNLFISSVHGLLSDDIRIKGDMRSIMQLELSGINHIYNFELNDTTGRKVLACRELTVDIAKIKPEPAEARIKLISITDPYVLFELIDSTNNLMSLLRPSGSEDTSATPADSAANTTSQPGNYSFSKLLISGGTINFNDLTLRYPFNYTIDNLKLDGEPADGSKGDLKFALSARLNGTGTMDSKARFNPDNSSNMDLDMKVSQFRMKDVDAYFKHYFGFPVTGGLLNYTTENQVRPGAFNSNNSIYFRKFTLARSMKTKVEYHVPLRLALAILSDKDGVIDIKAPVETKGEQVKVKNMGRIVLKIVGNLFVKAAVSPFKLLGPSYNADPASMKEIKLALLETQPDERNMKSVDILADILKNKPGLSIDIYYCSDKKADADSLAVLMISDRYRKTNPGLNGRPADSTFVKYLHTLVPGDSSIVIKDLCIKIVGRERAGAILDSIRNLQTAFLNGYLKIDKGLTPDKFRILTVTPDTIKPFGKYPAFRPYFTAVGDSQ